MLLCDVLGSTDAFKLRQAARWTRSGFGRAQFRDAARARYPCCPEVLPVVRVGIKPWLFTGPHRGGIVESHGQIPGALQGQGHHLPASPITIPRDITCTSTDPCCACTGFVAVLMMLQHSQASMTRVLEYPTVTPLGWPLWMPCLYL